jgi:para-aminobenzoate synthetase component 1
VPEFILCLYDRALVFDHQANVTHFVGPLGSRAPQPAPPGSGGTDTMPEMDGAALTSNFRRDEYLEAVQRVKDYIAAGDIFQANLSQRFEGPCAAPGLAVYERLRAVNPAPFAAYLQYPDFEIISSSPERFLLVEGDRVTTRPIKGTRPRLEGDGAFNRRMRQELLGSAKDHAELAMIVDLERNDLGRVCRYGTVRVSEHAVLETYPTVYHLVSTVEGLLYRQAHDEFSLIRAAFPGGSITGAPKIRAMEIIEELEPHARSVYTGSLGYISFHGRMDLNIVIRTMLKIGGRIYMHVGGGIVADSDPALEYCETLHKGKALFQAVKAANYDQIMEAASHER